MDGDCDCREEDRGIRLRQRGTSQEGRKVRGGALPVEEQEGEAGQP